MYPYLRLVAEFWRHRRKPPLDLFETHVSRHMVWPWDIDPWMELNNGRTLTLYDLGRVVLFERLRIVAAMRERRWAGTVAGSSVRYRHRLRMFDRYELRSRILGWDARFIYAEQSMWRAGRCTSQGLLRLAIANADGIVPTATVAQAMGHPAESPPLPEWVAAWIAAEALRPWPPVR